jgi:5'-nucleotidase
MLSTSRVSRARTALATLTGAGLVASTFALTSAAPAHAADPVDIQIIGTNDFHGRLLPDRDIPGAAKYAGAVDALRAENPNTIFAAAGDLIGATTFESLIQKDKPTIDALNAMDLDVSAVGNHELDQGYSDLVDRVMAPYDEATNPYGGAAWQYIAANIDEPGDADEIAPSWTTDVAGVTVGFVGAVTEHLPELVSPAGIEGLTVTDIVTATNEEAGELKAAGADVVVLLVHEGAGSTDCATMDDDPTSDFGSIINGVDGDVDAIVSGHTHLNYTCAFPVAEWANDATHPVKERPVVSAGQYGNYLNRMTFSVDAATGTVLTSTNENLNLVTGTYTDDPEVAQIVADAKAKADELGAAVLGHLDGALNRATKADGSENRGGESTAGNFVAEVQRWATRSETTGAAQIAFMNPGGIRGNLTPNEAGEITYRQAATVQPFANTLINMSLTGRQIRQLLEEQWQPEGASRPFLKLGVSRGFSYTYDPLAEAGSRIQEVRLHGKTVRMNSAYSVTANSFLASGGDNFVTFKEGTQRRDTGQTDLQGMVDYLAAHDPAGPKWKQQAVGLRWITDDVVRPGMRKVKVDLSSLAFTGVGDLQDTAIVASIGKQELGTFDVDNTQPAMEDPLSAYDETGTSKVRVRIPGGFDTKRVWLTLTGDNTGTTLKLPIHLEKNN